MSTDEAHPSLALDETVHQRVRLGILAMLSEASECTFTTVREELELTGTKITDAGLAQLKDLPGIKALNLRRCAAITDNGFAALKDLPNLNLRLALKGIGAALDPLDRLFH